MRRLLALLLVLGSVTTLTSHEALAKRRGRNSCANEFNDDRGGGGNREQLVQRIERIEQGLPDASTFDGLRNLLGRFGSIEKDPRFPNLYVFDNRVGARVEAHELYGAQRYSEVVGEHGETLVLLPQFEGISIPAVDGLVFDRQGRVTALFSLKHQFAFKGPEKPISDIRDRLERFYQNRSTWLPLVSLNNPAATGNYINEKTQALAAAFRMMQFRPGGGTTLRTRVVVSTNPESNVRMHPGQMSSAEDRINSYRRLFESVTMLMPHGTEEVFVDDYQQSDNVAEDEAS